MELVRDSTFASYPGSAWARTVFEALPLWPTHKCATIRFSSKTEAEPRVRQGIRSPMKFHPGGGKPPWLQPYVFLVGQFPDKFQHVTSRRHSISWTTICGS